MFKTKKNLSDKLFICVYIFANLYDRLIMLAPYYKSIENVINYTNCFFLLINLSFLSWVYPIKPWGVDTSEEKSNDTLKKK